MAPGRINFSFHMWLPRNSTCSNRWSSTKDILKQWEDSMDSNYMYKKRRLEVVRDFCGGTREICEERWMEGGLDQNTPYACMEFSNKRSKDSLFLFIYFCDAYPLFYFSIFLHNNPSFSSLLSHSPLSPRHSHIYSSERVRPPVGSQWILSHHQVKTGPRPSRSC